MVKHWLGQSDLDAEERKALEESDSIGDLFQTLGGMTDPTERQNEFRHKLEVAFPDHNSFDALVAILEQMMPKFLYVPEYNTLPGKVSVEAILDRQQKQDLSETDRVFIALTRLAGRTLEEIRDITTFEELNAEMEAISNRISKELFTYWTQNRHLHVEFRFTEGMTGDPAPFDKGRVFRTRIRNERHQVTVDFDERSTGFIWFFSFLVWFSQLKGEYGTNLIILLDEPGLGLHAKAQEDLLRYIRGELQPNYQVIYSAHSPFMIDPGELLRVRTVEDVIKVDGSGATVDILGTKVGEKVLSTDADTVFPLQAALGFDITQTLFVGEYTLIVEGPSDLLYLQWFSQLSRDKGNEGLDKRWVICPAGGVAKIGSFIALFGGNKLNIAVLTDFHQGIKRKVRELKESALLQQGRVFSADMFVNASEADVEDMIGRSNYVQLVNECYSLTGPNRVPASKPADAPDRVVEEVEAKFRTFGVGIPEFDHYKPSRYLMADSNEILSTLPELDSAIERFQTFFTEVNKLLPPK